MADPFTLTAIGIGASAGSGILGGISTFMGGKAQASQLAYQSAIAQANAKIAQQNADYSLQSGEKQAMLYGMHAGQQMGQIKVRQAASGIDIGSGSSQDVQKSQQLVTNLDLGQIRTNAARVAYGYSTQSAQDTAQAQMYSQASSNTMSALPFAVGGSLLSGVGSVSSKWLAGTQSGALSGSGLQLGAPGGTSGVDAFNSGSAIY